MFFIICINLTKHSVRIVNHTSTLEKAIEMVKSHSDDYVTEKNAPMMHRGTTEVPITDRVIFFTRKSPMHDYHIDVFRQSTRAVSNWTGTSYKDEELLVRRFYYTEYNNNLTDAVPVPIQQQLGLSVCPVAPPPPPPPVTPVVAAKPLCIDKRSNMTAFFPPDVMKSLNECERFQQSRISAELNHLPPMFKHASIPCGNVGSNANTSSVSSDDDDDECADDDVYMY